MKYRYFLGFCLLLLFMGAPDVASLGISLAAPIFQQDEVQIILEPWQPTSNEGEFLLPIRIAEPKRVATLEMMIIDAESGQGVFSQNVPVLGQPMRTFRFSLKGKPAGDYIIEARAIDINGNYILRKTQGFGSDDPHVLATTGIKYKPERSEELTFRIMAVNTRKGNLLIRLDIPDNVSVTGYEGLIIDSDGQEVDQFPRTPFSGNTIQERLPEAIRNLKYRKEFKLLLYLLTADGQRSAPQEYEFKYVPPPARPLFKRISISLKNKPGIFLGIVIIAVALILWAAAKGRKKRKEPTSLPRPPIDRTMMRSSLPEAQSPNLRPDSSLPQLSHQDRTPRAVNRARLDKSQSEQRQLQPHKETLPPKKNVEGDLPRLHLHVLESPDFVGPRQLTVSRFPFIIGRSKCDLILKDSQITRQHLKTFVKHDQIFIMDLGSKNGTFMNDEPLSAMKAYPITEKRRIRMGHHTVIEIIPVQPLGVR